MLKAYNPAAVAAPASAYSHGMEVPANARWLYVSGQVGVRPDGTLAEGFEAQADQALRNMMAVLAEAGMGAADLVRVNAYVTDAAHVKLIREIRARHFGDSKPASTLVVVAALAAPDWLFEVEAVAARVD